MLEKNLTILEGILFASGDPVNTEDLAGALECGAEETAGILAVDPKLVDWDNVEDMVLKPVSDEIEATGYKTVRYKGVEIPLVRPVTDISDNGWIGPDHPKNATVEWGTEMLEACAKYIADFMEAFRRAPLPVRK